MLGCARGNFRARGEHWSMSIGNADVIGDPEWYYEQEYGESPFEAGWMTEDEARQFIAEAARRFHDGEPSMAFI